jgi:hypothetical protein
MLGFASDGVKKLKPKLVKSNLKVFASPLVRTIVGLGPEKFATSNAPPFSVIVKSGGVVAASGINVDVIVLTTTLPAVSTVKPGLLKPDCVSNDL